MTSSTTTTTVTTRAQAFAFREEQEESQLSVFPQDVIINIFSKMSLGCLSLISSTCRYYNALSQDHFIWSSLFLDHFPFPLTNGIDSEGIHSLDAFKKEFALHPNLMNAGYTWHMLGKKDGKHSLSIDITGDQYISIHSNIILYGNIKSNEQAQEVSFEIPDVNRCIAAGGKIIAGLKNGEIQIFGPAHENSELQFVCEKTLTGHKKPVNFIALDNEKIYSYSADNTIRIWDATTGDCLATLGEFDETFKSLSVKDGKIAAACHTGEIKVWDVEDLESVITLPKVNDGGMIFYLVIDAGMIYASYEQGSILAWNIEKRNYSFFGQSPETAYYLMIVGDKLIAENGEGSLTIWDLMTKEHSPFINAGEMDQRLTALAFAEGRVIYGLDTGMLALLDFNASEEAILQEISDWFGLQGEGQSGIDQECLHDRFLRIAEPTKNIIYRQLYNRFYPLTKSTLYSDGLGSSFWFYPCGISRAEAINRYLNALSCGNLPLLESNPEGNFLLNLGFVEWSHFEDYLDFPPNCLSKIGILSSQDLVALGICFRPVAYLKLQTLNVDLLENRLELQRELLSTLKGMETGLHARAKVNFKNSLPQSKILWESFPKEIDDLYAQIETQCETEEGLRALFQPELYCEVINQVNALIYGFNNLDQQHLREKLKAYASQKNLESIWQTLQAGGIDSVFKLDLLSEEQNTNEYLFQLGKFN